jgi:hypothetical protein
VEGISSGLIGVIVFWLLLARSYLFFSIPTVSNNLFNLAQMNTTTRSINPQNPYVFDEYLFASQPHFVYEGSGYALFLRILCTGAPLLGILTASMVAYLALFQTPTYIKAFSRMILLCSIVDTLCALSDLLCQPVSAVFC